MKKDILKNITGTVSKAAFTLKKHSPEILIVVGVIGTVASAVLACSATTKVNDILADAKTQLDTIHECAQKPEMAEKYTEQDAQKDTTIVYVQTGVKLAKLYAPAVILGALSIASMVTSNNILKKRNVALAAAYGAVDKSFKEYRNRVKERFGDNVERELRYNLKAETIKENVTNEDGSTEEVEKTVFTGEPNLYSEYARIFDETNTNWEKDSEYNRFFLTAQQSYANDLLRARGHLFLNEVYDMLGFPRTKAGQVVGWLYNPDNPTGDNYVDFGMFDINNEKACDFVNGYERAIVLDFNVDGNIYDYI